MRLSASLMSDETLILLARIFGIIGVLLLAVSAVFGVLLASRTARKLTFLKGRAFRIHRLLSIAGAGLLLAHPVPVVLAKKTTGVSLAAVFVPFMAEKLAFNITLGALAFDILLIVLLSSLLIKHLPRRIWRSLHFGAYAVFVVGLYHGLLILNDFGPEARYAALDPLAFDKILIEAVIGLIVLASTWRITVVIHRRMKRSKARSDD